MKKTININLGGLVFQIDEDAFDRLSLYIETLKKRFHDIEERNEIIQDIEYRFAELFTEKFNKTKEVVSLEMVNSAIDTMGAPEEIEEEELFETENKTFDATNNRTFKSHKKLFRDPDNRVFAGVISGISQYLGINDAIWLRIIMVLSVFAGFGLPILIYILFWIVTPYARTASDKLQMQGDLINLDSIQNEVKKNINSDEIKRTTAVIADKASHVVPIILKVLGIILVLFFAFELLFLTIALFGGGFLFSSFNASYINLILNSGATYYIALISLYTLIATPLILAIYLGIMVFTKRKVNWVLSLTIALFLMILSFIGVSTSAYNVVKEFKVDAEQTNFVALENPSVEELNIEFPYEKLEDNINMNINLGEGENNDFNISGFKLFPSKKEIHINTVELKISVNKSDSIFKLSKTAYSKGNSFEDAEENLTHITNNFENLMENTISIPRKLILENETKWRVQLLKYKLEIPIGKRVYFGDNAKKVVKQVIFNGDYSRSDLANNTWEMTKSGLKCVSCE